jgi:hypothetical protein
LAVGKLFIFGSHVAMRMVFVFGLGDKCQSMSCWIDIELATYFHREPILMVFIFDFIRIFRQLILRMSISPLNDFKVPFVRPNWEQRFERDKVEIIQYPHDIVTEWIMKIQGFRPFRFQMNATVINIADIFYPLPQILNHRLFSSCRLWNPFLFK